MRHDESVSRDLTLPPDYADLLANLKDQVRSSRLRAHRVVNTELLTLYWRIGDAIRTRQEKAGWGAKIIDQLAPPIVKSLRSRSHRRPKAL